MNDLISFKNAQITALQEKLAKITEYNTQLETWVFELTADDCPEDYKRVVRNEVVNNY